MQEVARATRPHRSPSLPMMSSCQLLLLSSVICSRMVLPPSGDPLPELLESITACWPVLVLLEASILCLCASEGRSTPV